MKAFVIDVGICNGCLLLQIVCKDEHVGNDWTLVCQATAGYRAVWLRQNEFIRGTVPKVKMHYIPIPACTAMMLRAFPPAR